MAGLFDALGTATRGLQVIQRGLATTGHNIANADTPGYTRQRSVLQTGRPLPDATGTIGSGVEQVTIERIYDRFVNARLITETSRRAELDIQNSIYREVENVVNDQLAGGLTDELTGLFDAFDDLSNATEPGQPVARGQVLAAAQSLVDTIHRYDNQLRNLQRDTDRGITGLLPDINSLTSEIARLNGEIQEAETISPANDLRDRRDELVRELAGKLDVKVIEGDDGMIGIRIASGLALVEKRVASELVAVVDTANPNPFDVTFSTVQFRGSGSSFDVTSQITGGELGALIDARDSIIGGAIRDLDAFAYTVADRINVQHRQGVGLNDDAVYDFFTDLSATQTTVDNAARNISVSADIDPDQGGSLTNIAAAPRNVPPALPVPLNERVGNTIAIEALKNLRDEPLQTYLAGDAVGAPTGDSLSLSGNLINLIGEIGQRARTSSRQLEQQEAILSSVEDRRASISGVSIDEEVSELIKLQSNFQANARVITTVNQMLQSLYDSL